MNRVFGKKKAAGPPPPSLDEASSGVGKRVEMMDGRISQCDKELKVFKDKMKTSRNATAKKNFQRKAMEVLKRKRMLETQRDQMAGQQFNIDQASFGIESAKASVATVAAMKQANTELKQAVRHDLNIDDVEDIADDMAELMDDMNMMNEAMGRTFSTPEYVDEGDLEAELEMLDDEFDDELEADSVPSYLQDSLPAQPTSIPGSGVPESVDQYGLPIANTGA